MTLSKQPMARKSAFLPAPKRQSTKHMPQLSFYISGEMLLPEKIDAIQRGDMTVNGHTLMNLNTSSKITRILTGDTAKLYRGRSTHIQALRLIGRDV
jgi:hypothetical protein